MNPNSPGPAFPIRSPSQGMMQTRTSSAAKVKKLYFGYGSNLWRQQMRERCPDSTFEGVGRLSGYKWIIYERGYANIVKTDVPADEVYALVYRLTPKDERALDRKEGAPRIYQKNTLTVQFWAVEDTKAIDVNDQSKMKTEEMLVYIDRTGSKPSTPKDEYVDRMNKGIDDALEAGVPTYYVEQVMRQFIESTQARATRKSPGRSPASKAKDER